MHLTCPHRVPCLLIFVEEKIKKLAYTGIRTHDLEKDFPLLNHLSHHNSNNPVNPTPYLKSDFFFIFRAKDFDDLSREIAPPVIERLRRTYAHVDDIDLFPG